MSYLYLFIYLFTVGRSRRSCGSFSSLEKKLQQMTDGNCQVRTSSLKWWHCLASMKRWTRHACVAVWAGELDCLIDSLKGGGARLWPTEVGSVSGLANLRRICWIIRSPREGNITRPTIKIHHVLEWRLHYMEESECKEKNIIWNQWSRPCRIGIDNTMRILRFMEGQFRSSVSLLTQAFVRRNTICTI